MKRILLAILVLAAIVMISLFMGKPEHLMPELMKYHTSWDWLMPVVQKINGTGTYDIIIYRTTCHVNDEREILFETTVEQTKKKTILEAVYSAVVQFIQWYNQSTSKTVSDERS